MSDGVKIKKSIVFVAILVASLTFTQFQTLPVSALEFSTTKVTVPDTDRFGWSVQRFDNGFIVGEPFANSDNSGKVYIFVPSGTNSTITNPGGIGDNFGYSLNALGNALTVGAPGHNNNNGTVYLYDLGSPTTPTVSISNPANTIGERMGEDEMNFLDGDILVGVSQAENDGKSQAGMIYLFSSSDGSQLQTYSDPSEISVGGLFGRSISVDSTSFLTGAHGTAGDEGQAHIIEASSTITLSNPDGSSGDKYGWSTEITPTRYIVGAPHAEVTYSGGGNPTQGKVYLHHRDDPGVSIDVINSPDLDDIVSQNVQDQFGYDISESNDFIIVSAPYDDVDVDGTVYTDAGSVYVFSKNNYPLATIHNPDPDSDDLFGSSLDILDGSIVVGAPGDEGNTGAVYYMSISNEFAATLTIDADPNPVPSGEDTTITYTVKNIGTADLFDAIITIASSTCSSIDGPFSDDGDEILQAGEEWKFTCVITVLSEFTESVNEASTSILYFPDPFEDPQIITCEDPDFECGSVDVRILEGALTLDISANPITIYSGETSDVTFTVINGGNTPLFIHGATGIVDQNENCEPVASILDVITLGSQASVDFTCTVTGGTSSININATATAGIDQDNLTGITATAQYTIEVLNPTITLDISADPDPTYDGQLTTITYNVTNTGNSPVTIDGQTGVSEHTNICTPFAQTGTITLQPSEFVIFTCTVIAGTSQIDFDATATALDQNNNPTSADGTLTVNVIAPEITLNISSNPNPVNSGSTSLVTYTITNTGNSPVTIDGQTGVSEHTNICTPSAQTGTITLQPSEFAIFTCTVIADTSQIDFDATATAADENGREIESIAQYTLHVASLTLDIVPIPLQPLPGSSPTIEFTVTNNGSVVFDTITVDEILNADCTPTTTETGSLNPGEDRIFECVVSNVTGDFNIQGVATGIYNTINPVGTGQFVVQKTITVEIPVNLFCGRQESDFDQVFTGTTGNDHIKGSNGDDLIFGLEGNDKIQGKDGDDCIIAGDGNDSVWGGQGNDTIEGNTGNDKIHGQQGNDTIFGGDGNDTIYGGKGNDTIDAGTGNDRVHANQDNDVVTGGDGNDWLGAGIGNDAVSGGAGNDKIFGRPGIDVLNGDTGDDMIYGGQGDDTANGGDGNDKIYGHQGHDVLNGNNNDDYIHGGQGNDAIDGGNGSDRCNGAQGNNTIVNCEVEDKKMKEEQEENDDNEGESEPEDDDKKDKKKK